MVDCGNIRICLISGNHVLRFVKFFFSIGIMQISQRVPSKSGTAVLWVFGCFASLSWHLAYWASGKIGLATAIVFWGATAGVRHGMICYRTGDVSAAVAPVGTRWGSRFIASGTFAQWEHAMQVRWDPPLQIELLPRGRVFTWILPVPGTFVSSAGHSYPYPELYPGYGYSIFIPARNFCKFCTPVPQYPWLLEVL